jgi:hypothetical protein
VDGNRQGDPVGKARRVRGRNEDENFKKLREVSCVKHWLKIKTDE